MERHTLVSGEVLEFPTPPPPVAAFLARVRAAAEDPRVSEQEMIALIYERDNPLLKHGVIPGRGLVTRETFANPVYHVMLDLLDLKRIQRGTLDVDAVAARHTMTVSEAARQLGITPSAVRAAIAARTLPAWRQGSRWLLDPAAVEAYRVTGRRHRAADESAAAPGAHQDEGGAPAGSGGGQARRFNVFVSHSFGSQLDVRLGSAAGASLRLKAPTPLADVEKRGHATTGIQPAGWRRIAVKSGAGEDAAFFVLEPDDREGLVERDGFYVRGRFKLAERIVGNAQRASEAFKAFRPE